MSGSAEETAAVVVGTPDLPVIRASGRELSQRRRRRLVDAAREQVLEAVRTSRVVGRVTLVTGGPAEPPPGVEVVKTRDPPSAAVDRVATDLRADVQILALLRADLPLLQAEDVAFLVGRGRQGATVVVSPPASWAASVLVLPPRDLPPGGFPTADCRGLRPSGDREGAWERYCLEAGLPLDAPGVLARVYHAARPCRAKDLLKRWDGSTFATEGGP